MDVWNTVEKGDMDALAQTVRLKMAKSTAKMFSHCLKKFQNNWKWSTYMHKDNRCFCIYMYAWHQRKGHMNRSICLVWHRMSCQMPLQIHYMHTCIQTNTQIWLPTRRFHKICTNAESKTSKSISMRLWVARRQLTQSRIQCKCWWHIHGHGLIFRSPLTQGGDGLIHCL